jgi:hypothetical protein
LAARLIEDQSLENPSIEDQSLGELTPTDHPGHQRIPEMEAPPGG